MRVMIAKCPHCGRPVEATTEKLHEPVDCPHCDRPFEMEVPKVRVAEVREVSEEEERSHRMAEETPERVLIATHPAMFRAHPLRFLGVLLLLALAGFGVYYGAATANAVVLWGAAACVAVLLVLLVIWWLEVRATTLTVTDSRTILRKGLFSRATSEVEHDDVSNIQMDQSFLERLLRVGDIGVSSSGQDDVEVIARAIPHPNTVVQTIRDNQS